MAQRAREATLQFPVMVPVGPWLVHPHVLFESLGYLLGFQLFLALRRRRGDPEPMRALLVLAAVAGAVVGAKVLAWLEDPASVWSNRGDLSAWLEGKTIVGGLLGGWAGVELAKRRLGIGRRTGDLYALPLCLGIAVGRVGCFLTGLPDRTYGTATGWAWGVDFGDGVLRHPTQLYEIVFLVALAAGLLLLQRGAAEGSRFRAFLGAYLGWRLAIGFIQPAPTLLGLSAIQWACVAGLLWLARPLLERLRAPAAGRMDDA